MERQPTESKGRFAGPVLAVLAVLCCAGAPLVAALAATGVGAWLAAHGYALGVAGALVLLSALLLRQRSRRFAARPRQPSVRR